MSKSIKRGLAGVAQWIECWLANPRGGRFDSQSGYMPGLRVRSPVGVHRRQPHIDVSLPLFLPPFPSLKYIYIYFFFLSKKVYREN